MSNWKETIVNIGTVKPNSRKLIVFESLKKLDITSIQPCCSSCTKVVSYKENLLTVSYKANEIPFHLRGITNNLVIDKCINIYYSNGEHELLKFIGNTKV